MSEKIFRKEYKEVMKICAIFAFSTSISIEKVLSQVNFRRDTQNNILNFPGVWGQGTLFKKFGGSVELVDLHASLLSTQKENVFRF